MKKLTAIILVTAFIAGPLTLHAAGKGPFDDFLESAGKIVALTSVNQIIFYGVIASYHSKFNKWPANRDELIKAMSDGSIEAKKEQGKDPKDVLTGLEGVTFTRLDDGTLLVEARYSDELEGQLQKIGLGKCRISAIASRTKEGYVFTPSEKTKNNRDYLTIPAKLKLK
jgi:hypothetical protein